MSDAHLVKMANDIGAFFRAEPDREEAVGGVVNHIAKFWTRRMREKLVERLRAGETGGFDELTLEAVRRLATTTGAADGAPNAP